MKRINTFLIMAILLVMGLGRAKAQQVVDVCAGNDSVVLRLGNFQYGYVQWQVSEDNGTWSDIEGAIDTVYKFLPERPRYYRAEVKFPQCSEYNYHSQVSYVQMPPKAYAGPDMDVPANVPVRLCASTFQGAEGEWSVIEGFNGTFDDMNDPHTMFIGGEGEYKLVWTLTNSCGYSSDTLNINCVAMEYNSKILIVDETDAILSDTLQMINGEYAIVFTDTVPEVTEGTVLLGYREKPFMRKVTSFEKVGDVFVMQTEQAAISDIILSGAMCFDPIGDIGDIDSTRMRVLDRYPTRKEMAADPFLLRDGGVYFVKGKECREDRGISISIKNGKMTTKVSVNLSMFHSSLEGLELEFTEVAEPNFRTNIMNLNGDMTNFYMGLYNEKITKTYKLKASKQVTATDVKLEGYLNPQQWIVGGFMVGLIPTVVTVDLPITGTITASLNGLEVGYTKEWTGTHAIEWRDGSLVVIDKAEPVEKSWEPFNITGHLDAKIGLGLKVGVLLVDALGPTVTIKGTFGPELCFSITPPNTLTGDLAWGVDLNLACRLQAFSHDEGVDFWAHDFHLFRGSWFAPSRLLRAGGDQQVYNPMNFDFIQSGGFLPEYIKVNTKGWFGSNMPFALVHFEPDEGGEVSDSPIIANVHGIASVRWKPGTSAGIHRLKAWAYDCDGNVVAGSPLVFHAYTEGTGACWTSGLTADFVEHVSANGIKTVELLVTGGTEPYEYSTDATNYYPLLQTVGFTPQHGQSYVYYVRDAYGCETEAYYNEPYYDCHASTLGLDVQVINGNTVRASAIGGFSPYWFSIDDINFTPGLNGQYSFVNLIDGTYDVTVRDAMGCVQSKTVVVEREANVGLSIVDAGYDIYGNPTGTVQMMASVQTIYDRGLCWCIKTDAGVMPTVYDFRLSYGSGSNDYGFTLQGLDSQKTYYVRAYVLCDAGTAYSNVLEVTPNYLVTKPFVYLTAVSSTTNTSANCSSNVINDGHAEVTDRGFCWSATNPSPTLADSHISCGTGTGVFSGTLTGLESNTHYYVCAYATNSYGTAYGNEVEFTTVDSGGTGEVPQGAINGLFSVGENQQVYFSQGNLQYKESIWRFAEHQWNFCGGSEYLTGVVYGNVEEGWMDLFGWGTSGYDHGAVCYQPWSSSSNDFNYWAYGDWQYNLFDQTGQADWGYNTISNGGNQENLWRTPTIEEWEYLFNTRTMTNGGPRYTIGKHIEGVHGVVLYPDDYTGPEVSSDLSAAEWSIYESLGCVFLPGAGDRAIAFQYPSHGYYWSASSDNSDHAQNLWFKESQVSPHSRDWRYLGFSVRLIHDAGSYLGQLPQVTTSDVTVFNQNSAICGGEVVSEGGTAVTERGVCWSTNHNPTLSTNHASAGAGMGAFVVNATGLMQGTTYYVRAYATNANGTAYGNEVSFTTSGGGIGTHEYVDLGLPSGTLWATCNVGANSPEESGDYFAWGETTTKDVYDWSTYRYCMGSQSTLTKYCSNASYGYNGFTDNLTTLLPEDDAATVNWGSGWCIPTAGQWGELYQNTTSTWTTQNGVPGRLFTAQNGNSLFLPRSWFGTSGSQGWYWSSELYIETYRARYFYFTPDYNGVPYWNRDKGHNVRPVRSTRQK